MKLLEEKRLTIDEAAKLLGMHRTTIDRWCRYGCGDGRRLRRFKQGSRLVVLERDLEEWIASTSNLDVPPPECGTNDDLAERVRRADEACEKLGA